MNIIEAIKNAKEGKQIRREDWRANCYLVYVHEMETFKDEDGAIYSLSVDDIESVDWCIYTSYDTDVKEFINMVIAGNTEQEDLEKAGTALIAKWPGKLS